MADLPDSNDDTCVGLDRGSLPSTPRWVKVFGIIAVLLILLFIILHLTGQGPGLHGGHTPPASITEQSVLQP
jgi:hypothetical protein